MRQQISYVKRFSLHLYVIENTTHYFPFAAFEH